MIVPDKFNMVDMEGIDLLRMQGVAVEGLYDKLVESIALCRYQCLYNWKFNDILIPPTYVEMEVGEDEEVIVNFGITVTADDVIHLQTIEPGPAEPVIIPLFAEENMEYNAPSGVDGFDPVTVDVPSYVPVIESLSITENGIYTAGENIDGYSPVSVDVPSCSPVINPITIIENGIYNAPTGVDGYSPVTVNVSGSSNILIKNASIITASDIVAQFDSCIVVAEGSATGLQEAGISTPINKYRSSSSNILFVDLGAENTSATIYAVIKALTSSGDFGGLVFDYNWATGKAPMFYTRSNTWYTGVYGQDQNTSISSNVFRVLALAVNGTSKIARYFIGNQKIRDGVTFTNSGRYGSWGGGYSNSGVIQAANSFEIAYGAVVRGIESDQEILDNMAAISAAYSNILGA